MSPTAVAEQGGPGRGQGCSLFRAAAPTPPAGPGPALRPYLCPAPPGPRGPWTAVSSPGTRAPLGPQRRVHLTGKVEAWDGPPISPGSHHPRPRPGRSPGCPLLFTLRIFFEQSGGSWGGFLSPSHPCLRLPHQRRQLASTGTRSALPGAVGPSRPLRRPVPCQSGRRSGSLVQLSEEPDVGSTDVCSHTSALASLRPSWWEKGWWGCPKLWTTGSSPKPMHFP